MDSVRTWTALIAVGVMLCAVAAVGFAQMDACSDCEDADGDFKCGSAGDCLGKMPGFYCYNNQGKCYDINHPDCLDEPQEVCCGCKLFNINHEQEEDFDPSLPIPDGGGDLTVSIFVEPSQTIDFLDVHLRINHLNMNDLVIQLYHDGLGVTLLDRPPCPLPLFCDRPLNLGDVGIAPIQCEPSICDACFPALEIPENGVYMPLEPLSVFNGMDMAGEWKLIISDLVPGNAGELCGWGLMFGDWDVTAVPGPNEGPISWTTLKVMYR
jgi:subtilisin-like proprotein convertase family protein